MAWKRYAETHPYAFSVALVALILFFDAISGIFVRTPGAADITRLLTIATVGEVVLALIVVLLVTRMGWWREIGFRKPRRPRDFWLFWLPAIPIIMNLLAGVQIASASNVALFFSLALLAGFVEEGFFRGLMLRALSGRGLWPAAIFTSVLFGLLHSLNVLAGADPWGVLLQMGYAMALGFLYAALVIRAGMIWPAMLAHFLTDFAGFMASGQVLPTRATAGDVPQTLIYMAVFAAYGAFLLVRGKPATT